MSNWNHLHFYIASHNWVVLLLVWYRDLRISLLGCSAVW